MTSFFRREALPQNVLAILPFLLFFPSGIRYTGVVLFAVALLFAGGYREKWQTARQSPLFWPVMAMFAATCVAAIFLDRSAEKFWSGFAHYQIYFFLLSFISVGGGEWQRRAVRAFFIGALCAATLFYLNALGLLPNQKLFVSYLHYSGNNSILLGILLALASGGLLYEVAEGEGRRQRWYRLAAFLYISAALLFFAQTRTGALLFVVLCGMALFKATFRSWRRALVSFLGLVLVSTLAWQASDGLRSRVLQTSMDIQNYMQGSSVSGQGMRLEIYEKTLDIIAEKPLTGHGVAQWVPLYRQHAKGLSSEMMAAPHNDYLLYMAEIGLLGLAALLAIWVVQLALAWRLGGREGMWVGMLTVGLIVGAMFNAILRDSVFGMPFMILLAIPLAGVKSPEWKMVQGRRTVNA